MSIRERGSGWQVRVRPFPEQTVPTKAWAQRLELELRHRKALGDLYDEAPTTLKEELAGYIDRKKSTGRLQPRTIEYLERTAAGWSRFASLRLPQLRRSAIEDHVAGRAAKHPRSAKNELALLKAVLRQADDRGQRFDGSILAIPPVRHAPRVGQALTIEQVDAIAAVMPEYVKRIAPVALRTGMRQHELFLLADDALDLAAGTLQVRKSKTDAGVRTVRLSKVTVQLLREQLLARPKNTQLVFPKSTGGQWTRHHFRERVWQPAVESAKFESVTFHLLRHSAVSMYAQAGWRIEHVGKQLGWTAGSLAAMFARYRHLFEGEMEARVEDLDAFETAAAGARVVEERSELA